MCDVIDKISGDMAGVSCPCCGLELVVEEYVVYGNRLPSGDDSDTGAYCENCSYILMPDEYRDALMEKFGD
tara:strand:+ start:291 stop:503 length:213 start_codon:yes stop_codon:yes gene_type:complete